MKVALCFSGLLRTATSVYESIYENIIKPNECDVFVSTWDIWGNKRYKKDTFVGNVDGNLEGTPSCAEKSLKSDNVKSLFRHNLIEFEIESLTERYDELGRQLRKTTNYETRPFQIAHRIASMHFKINSCDKMRRHYEETKGFKYDCVVRIRPDIYFNSPLIFADYSLNNSTVFIPEIMNYGYMNDQFAFGSGIVMEKYAGLIDSFFSYTKHVPVYLAEACMMYHANRCKLQIVRLPEISYHIVRGHVDGLGSTIKPKEIKLL